MSELLSVSTTGLSLGCTYALVAMGIVILYKGSSVLNFSHGSIAVFGAYVTARLTEPLGFWMAALLGIVAAAGVSLLIERLLVNRMRNAGPISMAILTIGIEIVLRTELARRIGIDILPLGQPWGTRSVVVGGAIIPWNRIITIAVTVLIVAVFLLVFRYSRWGISMRAAAEDRETAEIVGVKLGSTAMITWLAAGALAAVAGILLTGAPSSGLSPVLSTVVLRALAAAIIGGLDSITGALVGGAVVGCVEAVSVTYQNELSFLGLGVSDVGAFGVMFLVLLVRPQGLFGSKELVRV
ncbi:branched-chain amino acid ABC transporter permease [Pimelobacter simplex]|uniref:branched-chain amino acid ABC transporter permease n=1 Tax=Nocardioides simplex TaxID=2045 RepID=UPI0019313039|nr:branched-chain amino acid ABC transporter permease [Pimelobacter simplex]